MPSDDDEEEEDEGDEDADESAAGEYLVCTPDDEDEGVKEASALAKACEEEGYKDTFLTVIALGDDLANFTTLGERTEFTLLDPVAVDVEEDVSDEEDGLEDEADADVDIRFELGDEEEAEFDAFLFFLTGKLVLVMSVEYESNEEREEGEEG